ncbi:MAG: hypothetical protein KGN74_02915 [Gemmatimonadota bacterium]|nr:hypothetical protein [Gemmatimonadota bacterium]MDE3217713.1 hypothetical protein [Gemmatimonadota bacterium]
MRFRRTRSIWLARRVALFALLALELAAAIGPILEPHHEASETHIEQTGTTHHFLVHDAQTCAICALRSIRSLPSTGRVLVPGAAPARLRLTPAFMPAVARDRAANSSRAPPVTG